MKKKSTEKKLDDAFDTILRGEESAFDIIEAHYQPILYDYLMRNTGQVNRSRETVEEASYSMRPFLPQMKTLDELVWQLFKTARNFCADIWETDTRKLEPPAYEDSPSEKVMELELALRQLPPAQRECLLLKERYDLNDEQISKITAFNRDQIQSILQQTAATLGDDLLSAVSKLNFYTPPEISDDQTKDLSIMIKGVRRSGAGRLLQSSTMRWVFVLIIVGIVYYIWKRFIPIKLPF